MVVGADLPRATAADAARTMVGESGTGSLSTLAVSPPGYPFGSVVSYATDAAGRPLFIISEIAEHTRNLRRDPRCSLLVTELGRADGDPLALGRVTLVGDAAPVPPDDQPDAIALVTGRLPSVGGYAGFGDFSCWRIDVTAVRWVGGFGRMDWVDPDAYREGVVDEALARRHDVIEHMNADHADAGALLCQRAIDHEGPTATVSKATFDHVDRLGCEYVATTDRGTAYVRLGFAEPASSVDEVRAAVVALVREARGA